jgi:hypothetical protein
VLLHTNAKVIFPKGDSWSYYFNSSDVIVGEMPHLSSKNPFEVCGYYILDKSHVLSGSPKSQGTGVPVDYTSPLDEFPAFHRVGAIIPLNITDNVTG